MSAKSLSFPKSQQEKTLNNLNAPKALFLKARNALIGIIESSVTKVEINEATSVDDLKQHQIVWNEINNAIVEDESLNIKDSKLTSNAITTIYIALNSNLNIGALQPDVSVAVWPGGKVPTELPEDAKVFIFSNEAVINLAKAIEVAVDQSQLEKDLTSVQEAMVNLRSGVMHSKDLLTIENSIFLELLKIANP